MAVAVPLCEPTKLFWSHEPSWQTGILLLFLLLACFFLAFASFLGFQHTSFQTRGFRKELFVASPFVGGAIDSPDLLI